MLKFKISNGISITIQKVVLSTMEKEGLTIVEAAKRFAVGTMSVSRWKHNPEPDFKRNRPAQKIDMEALKKDVDENPDSYIFECAERFSVSESGMRSALKRLGVSRKKTLKHPKADEQVRTEFETQIEKYKSEGNLIIYIDESGFAHESTRSHGYSEIGQRCLGKANWGAKGRTNVIGALLNGVLLTTVLF